MDDLYRNHRKGKIGIHRRDSQEHLSDYHGGVMEEDRRLALYGYSVETLNMLVLPMVKTK